MTTTATKRKARRIKSPAERAHDQLVLYIRDFESRLDAEQEITMGFAGDATGVLRIEGIGFFPPDIVTFYGMDETGTRTQLIQHVSQLSVTLRAISKDDETDDPPRRIGFQLTTGWTGGGSGDASA
ncbi:DUF6173 family protein [Tabrizicola sp.]|uniref:DUF6173 family protein n=1 Tax=Tabrizicola sp. TaxID=2005166 RepID=UPI00262BB3EA|nr:DUF6173 family protein [Tabrizicola sp.]MDM7932459.1 DUF6173 family protein [Tabrizicola sp.]